MVYVRGFPKTYTPADLRSLFLPFNCRRKIKITDKDNKHYALLKFENCFEAEKAIGKFHKFELEGNKLYVRYCYNSKEYNLKNVYPNITYSNTNHKSFRKEEKLRNKEKKRTIYMRNFPEEITENEVKEIFGKYGDIEHLKLKEKFCLIRFENISDCKRVLGC